MLGRFPRERTQLLPVLHAVQEETCWIPAWAMEEVSAYLKVPASEVHGVVSSFPELRLKAPGRHLLRVCTGLSCYLNGGLSVLEGLEKSLGIEAGGTTPDGVFTLEEAPCLFVCPAAPAVEWDGICSGRMTTDRAVALVRAGPNGKRGPS